MVHRGTAVQRYGADAADSTGLQIDDRNGSGAVDGQDDVGFVGADEVLGLDGHGLVEERVRDVAKHEMLVRQLGRAVHVDNIADMDATFTVGVGTGVLPVFGGPGNTQVLAGDGGAFEAVGTETNWGLGEGLVEDPDLGLVVAVDGRIVGVEIRAT